LESYRRKTYAEEEDVQYNGDRAGLCAGGIADPIIYPGSPGRKKVVRDMGHPELLKSSANSPTQRGLLHVFDGDEEKNFQFFSSSPSKTCERGFFSY
jgi:hypothetical protein